MPEELKKPSKTPPDLQKAFQPRRSEESTRIYTFLSLLFIVLVAVMFYVYLTQFVIPGGARTATLSGDDLKILLQKSNISITNSQADALSGALTEALQNAARDSTGAATTTVVSSGSSGGAPGVTVTEGGRTINIYVTSGCCGTCEETPSCPPPEPTPTPTPEPTPTPTCSEQDGYCGYDGDCCTGLVCSPNQQCIPPVPEPEPTPTCGVNGDFCQVSSDCCGGYACINNRCDIPQPSCTAENVSCDFNSECCDDLKCIQGACQPPPPPPPPPSCGETGAYCASSTECCEGFVCTQNQQCTPTPQQLCSETDSGADYYNQGTTTGYLNGLWGAYTDYCSGNTINEYYCQTIYGYDNQGYPTNTPTQNVTRTSLICTNGCSAGRCT